jgi:hypothetical protein
MPSSFKKLVYSTCRSIGQLDSGKQIAEVLENLKRENFELSQTSWQFASQFLGYLIVFKNIGRFSDFIPQELVRDLTKQESITLEAAHLFLAEISQTVRDNLNYALPGIGDFVDPYLDLSAFQKVFGEANSNYQIQSSSAHFKLEVFPSNIADKLKQDLLCHPQVVCIHKCIASLARVGFDVSKIPSSTWQNLTNVLLLELHQAETEFDQNKSLLKSSELLKMYKALHKDSIEYFISKISISLSILKMVLTIINQLVFQLYIYGARLICIDESVTYSCQEASVDDYGRIIVLACQPEFEGLTLKPFDVIYVNLEHQPCNLRDLFYVLNIGVQYDADYGMTQKLTLRLIDDNLNPFPQFESAFEA